MGSTSRRCSAGGCWRGSPPAAWKIRVFRSEFFGVDLLLDGAEPVQAAVVDAEGGVVRFDDRGDVEALAAQLASVAVTLDDVAQKDASQRPKPPFTTSTMQQAASSRLH